MLVAAEYPPWHPLVGPRAGPDGAHTHGSGGSGLGRALLVLLGAALAVNLAGPVVAAAAELLRVLLIVAG